FALTHVGSKLAESTQPLVPERVFLSGDTQTRSASEGNGDGHTGNGSSATIATTGLVGMLLQTLLAERTSFANGDSAELASLRELTSRLTRSALANMPCAGESTAKGLGTEAVEPMPTAREISSAN